MCQSKEIDDGRWPIDDGRWTMDKIKRKENDDGEADDGAGRWSWTMELDDGMIHPNKIVDNSKVII